MSSLLSSFKEVNFRRILLRLQRVQKGRLRLHNTASVLNTLEGRNHVISIDINSLQTRNHVTSVSTNTLKGGSHVTSITTIYIKVDNMLFLLLLKRGARKRSGRLELMPFFQCYFFRLLLKYNLELSWLISDGHFKQSLATIAFIFNRVLRKEY